jgi:hypothetical protein
MSSLEEEHKFRSTMLINWNLTDDELDKLIKDKIDELNGYINASAAMSLINDDLGKKSGVEAEPLKSDPETKVRDKIVAALIEQGHAREDLDRMVEALQKKSIFMQKDKMLAYDLIALRLGVTIHDDPEGQARAIDLSTVADALDISYKENIAIRALVIGQRVQRKKGGDWTKLYTTTVVDKTGKYLTLKTSKRDNDDFSHLFLNWGSWYNFYGINRSEGDTMQDMDGNPKLDDFGDEQTWPDTWWWSGEAEQLYDVPRDVPATPVTQMHDSYQNYVISGIITSFHKLRDWSLFDPYTDNFLKSQSINQPKDKKIRDNLPGEDTLGQDGVYVPWSNRFRFSLSTPEGRVEVSTRGFDILLSAWQHIGDASAQKRLKSKSMNLDGCRVILYGNLTENPNTHEQLFMSHGLLTVEESGKFDGVQGVLDELLGEVVEGSDEPKKGTDDDPSAYVHTDICVMCGKEAKVSSGTASCKECDSPTPVNQEQIDQEKKDRTELTQKVKGKIKAWYLEYIIAKPSAVAFQTFKDDMWKGIGWKGPDNKVADAIQLLIDEGLVREWKGAMIYPNN